MELLDILFIGFALDYCHTARTMNLLLLFMETVAFKLERRDYSPFLCYRFDG